MLPVKKEFKTLDNIPPIITGEVITDSITIDNAQIQASMNEKGKLYLILHEMSMTNYTSLSDISTNGIYYIEKAIASLHCLYNSQNRLSLRTKSISITET